MIKRRIKEYIIMFSSFSLMPCFCYIKYFFAEAKQSTYIENIYKNYTPFNIKNVLMKNENFNNSFKQLSEYKVKLKIKNEIKEMKFWEYLVGVVIIECSPTIFHEKTVICNILAAASYAIAKRGLDGVFEADNNVFQAFMPPEEYNKKFSRNVIERLEKLCKFFSNYVLAYKKGEDYRPVEALYHTISSGITQNSKDVWGSEVSYLVSKKSPIEEFYAQCDQKDLSQKLKGLKTDEEKNKLSGFIKQFKMNYEQKIKISPLDAFNKVKSYIEKNNIKANLTDIKDPKYVDKTSKYIEIKETIPNTKHVKTVSVFGANFSGPECARIFGLRSSCFSVKLTDDDKLEFVVKGYGHCVGMDQYGANIFALKGDTAREILKHFYGKDCKIIRLSNIKPQYIFKNILKKT